MLQTLKCWFGFHRSPHPYARWFRGGKEVGECLHCFHYVAREPGENRWRSYKASTVIRRQAR